MAERNLDDVGDAVWAAGQVRVPESPRHAVADSKRNITWEPVREALLVQPRVQVLEERSFFSGSGAAADARLPRSCLLLIRGELAERGNRASADLRRHR